LSSERTKLAIATVAIIIVAVVVIAAIAGVAAISLLPKGNSNKSSTALTTFTGSTTSSPTGVSSATSLSSGSGPISISIVRIVQDTPESNATGKSVYILNVEVSNTGSESFEVNPDDFEAVGSSGSVYNEVDELAMTVPQTVFIDPGQQTTLQIGFELAVGDSPSTLQYVGHYVFSTGTSNVDVSVGIPSPSGDVTDLLELNSTLTGSAADNASVTGDEVTNTSQPSGSYFYTGDIIAIQISLGYSILYTGSSTFQVTSITNSWGLQMVETSPALPTSFGSSGTTVTIYLLVGKASHSGTLGLTIDIEP
jgi:Domain of unknown function (DUF4352)